MGKRTEGSCVAPACFFCSIELGSVVMEGSSEAVGAMMSKVLPDDFGGGGGRREGVSNVA